METVKENSAGIVQARRSRNKRFDSSRKKENLINHVLSLNWIASVASGGKRQRVCALVIVGNGNGSAGYNIGKAKEVSDAVRKAMDKASRSLFRISLKECRTFHHDADVKYCSTRMCLRSAPVGTGIIASEVVRSCLEALGVKDAVVKIIGSNNPHNVVKALFKGIFSMQSPKMLAIRRGVPMSDIVGSAVPA